MIPDRLLPTPGSAGCPECNRRVPPAAIVRRRPDWDETEGSWVQVARFYCAACHHIVSWQETCDRAGQRARPIRGTLGVMRDPRAVREFICRYPLATRTVTPADAARQQPLLTVTLTQSAAGDWTASSPESPEFVGVGTSAIDALRELLRRRGDARHEAQILGIPPNTGDRP